MKKTEESPQFGRVQLRIMQILWEKDLATAREITEALNARHPSEPIAHSTVQTLLRGLEDKRSVSHEAEGRTFVFRPLVEEGRFKQNALGDLVERVFGGNLNGMMAHLLKNEKISRKELGELRRLIEERSEKKETRQ